MSALRYTVRKKFTDVVGEPWYCVWDTLEGKEVGNVYGGMTAARALARALNEEDRKHKEDEAA